jgi:hypothetical protein
LVLSANLVEKVLMFMSRQSTDETLAVKCKHCDSQEDGGLDGEWELMAASAMLQHMPPSQAVDQATLLVCSFCPAVLVKLPLLYRAGCLVILLT